jgi:hypothetical protein
VNTNLASKIQVTPLQKTIAANLLGLSGKIRFAWNFACNNSAGSKTMGISLAGTTVSSTAVTTATFGNKAAEIVGVRGVASRMVPASGGSLNIITSVDAILAPELSLSAANDFIAIESYVTELLY